MARQGDHPSNDVYTLKQVLQEHNTTYEIVLCRSQLKQARVLSTCSMACSAYQTTHDGLVVSVSVVCLVILKKLVACWAGGSAKLKTLKASNMDVPCLRMHSSVPRGARSMCAESVHGCQGLWRAAIYNPMHIYKISYNLTVSRTAACLNNCSQHGTCTADGLCHCEGDWYVNFLPERQHCAFVSVGPL